MGPLFRPGTSPLHRLPTGPKLLILIGLVTTLSLTSANPALIITALAATLALYAIAFPKNTQGLHLAIKQIWSLKYLLAIIVIPQLLIGGVGQVNTTAVATNTLRLIDAILLATLFTLTTQISSMVATIERALQPVLKKPETVSLGIAMAINAIPMLIKFLTQTKEAQQARGVRPSATLITVPLLIASLKYADEFAEALTARGVEI